MTRKGLFPAAMAGFAALLAAAAAVEAAPKTATPAEASSQSKTSADAKAPAKKADKKTDKADKKAAAKDTSGKKSAAAKSPAKTSEKKADKKAAKKADKKAKASAAKAAVPLPKRRPAESATATGAFPTPIGTAPILSSSFISAQPVAETAAAPLIVPRREAALTPPNVQVPAALAPAVPISPESLAAVKKAIELTRRGRNSEATAVAGTVTDPVAVKLIEWVVLRAETGDFDFQRYAGFATENPGWPNINQFRRKAEAALFQNGVNDAVVRRYFATTKPLTAKGKLAYARALMAQGDREQAQPLVRDAWRTDALGADMERQVLDSFRPASVRRRPQGADGSTALCRGYRRGVARGAAARRLAGRDRQGLRGGQRQIIQNQRAAGCRAWRRAWRHGLPVRPRTTLAACRPGR